MQLAPFNPQSTPVRNLPSLSFPPACEMPAPTKALHKEAALLMLLKSATCKDGSLSAHTSDEPDADYRPESSSYSSSIQSSPPMSSTFYTMMPQPKADRATLRDSYDSTSTPYSVRFSPYPSSAQPSETASITRPSTPSTPPQISASLAPSIIISDCDGANLTHISSKGLFYETAEGGLYIKPKSTYQLDPKHAVGRTRAQCESLMSALSGRGRACVECRAARKKCEPSRKGHPCKRCGKKRVACEPLHKLTVVTK